MTLGELKELAVKHGLDDDTQLIIETEEEGAGKYTGVIRGSLLIGGHGHKLINLLPATCLRRIPMEDEAIRRW